MFGYIKTRPSNLEARTSSFSQATREEEAAFRHEESSSGFQNFEGSNTKTASIAPQTAGYLSWESISYFFGKWTTDEYAGAPPLGKKLEETQVDSELIEQQKKPGTMSNMENTTEYTVSSHDTLPKIALKFDVTPSELTRLNKLVIRTLYPGQVLKVPCPKPTEDCSECKAVEDVAILKQSSPKSITMNHHIYHNTGKTSIAKRVSFDDIDEDVLETFIKVKSKYITDGQGVVKGFLLITPHAVMFHPDVSEILVVDKGVEYYQVNFPMESVCAAGMFDDIAEMADHDALEPGHFFLDKPLMKWLGESSMYGGEEKQMKEDEGSSSTLHASLSTTGIDSEDLTETSESIVVEQLDEPKPTSHEDTIVQQIMSDILEKVNQNIDESENSTVDVVVSSSCHQVFPNDHTLPSDTEQLYHVTSSGHAHQMNSTPKLAPYQGNGHNSCEEKDEGIEGHSYSEGISKDSGIEEHFSRESVYGDLPRDTRWWKEGDVFNRKDEFPLHEINPRPSTCHVDMPKYMCIRLKKACWPALRPRLSSHAHETIQRANDERREYWFSIPSARLFDVYAFFLELCPAIHDGETDEESSDLENSDHVGSCGSDYSVITMSEVDNEGFKLVDNFFSRSPGKEPVHRKRTHSRNKKKKKKKIPENEVPRKLSTWSDCTLDEPMIPEMIGKSEILNECDIIQLSQNLPSRTVGHSWRLIYSTYVNGISLKTLYRNMTEYESSALIVIKDKSQKVFGAFASDPFAVSDHFYGTGESFLFSFYPEFRIYRWSGENYFFIKGDIDSLAFGGGEGNFGLWLDGDLYYGSSHPCKTFNNEPLTDNEDFICSAVETWCFE